MSIKAKLGDVEFELETEHELRMFLERRAAEVNITIYCWNCWPEPLGTYDPPKGSYHEELHQRQWRELAREKS